MNAAPADATPRPMPASARAVPRGDGEAAGQAAAQLAADLAKGGGRRRALPRTIDGRLGARPTVADDDRPAAVVGRQRIVRSGLEVPGLVVEVLLGRQASGLLSIGQPPAVVRLQAARPSPRRRCHWCLLRLLVSRPAVYQ